MPDTFTNNQVWIENCSNLLSYSFQITNLFEQSYALLCVSLANDNNFVLHFNAHSTVIVIDWNKTKCVWQKYEVKIIIFILRLHEHRTSFLDFFLQSKWSFLINLIVTVLIGSYQYKIVVQESEEIAKVYNNRNKNFQMISLGP